jgi:hypothetical protein
MSYKIFFAFLEGEDDERFFNKIILPFYEKKYDYVVRIQYAQKKKSKINDYLKTIKSMGADHIFFADIDNIKCITDKKNKIKKKYKFLKYLNTNILVVIKEIESWYYAGLTKTICRKLKIKDINNTDMFTKEQFDQYAYKLSGSKINFMVEILKNYSIPTAKKKNKSFRYFNNKHMT